MIMSSRDSEKQKVERYQVGFIRTFIQDHPFSHVCEIPIEVAVTWVQRVCPDANIGHHVLAKDVTIDGNVDTGATNNGWLNNLFVVIARDHGKAIAIINWDGKFSIYQQD